MARKPTTGKKAQPHAENAPRHVLTRLNQEGWLSLKILSAEKGRPLQDFMVEAINDLLRKYGKKPTALGPPAKASEE